MLFSIFTTSAIFASAVYASSPSTYSFTTQSSNDAFNNKPIVVTGDNHLVVRGSGAYFKGTFNGTAIQLNHENLVLTKDNVFQFTSNPSSTPAQMGLAYVGKGPIFGYLQYNGTVDAKFTTPSTFLAVLNPDGPGWYISPPSDNAPPGSIDITILAVS